MATDHTPVTVVVVNGKKLYIDNSGIVHTSNPNK